MSLRTNAKGGIGKFASAFKNAASGQKKHIEMIETLSMSLQADPQRVINHLIKEQGFANEEALVEKNELLMQ